jgi:hypothetical protein
MSCHGAFHSRIAPWRKAEAIHDPAKWITAKQDAAFAEAIGKRKYEDFIPARKLPVDPSKLVA